MNPLLKMLPELEIKEPAPTPAALNARIHVLTVLQRTILNELVFLLNADRIDLATFNACIKDFEPDVQRIQELIELFRTALRASEGEKTM